MMSLVQFKSRTDYDSDSNAGAVVRGFLKLNRGPNLAVIDSALESYEKAALAGNAAALPSALERVVVACQWWLKLKQGKIGVKTETTNTDTRAQAIAELKLGAMQELGQLSGARAAFAQGKTNAINQGTVAMKVVKGSLTKASEAAGTTSLSHGYGHERNSYVDSRKVQAISASAIYADPRFDHNISYKDYKKAYQTLAREGAQGDQFVAYLPKADRLSYMLVCQNGVFSYPDGAYAKSSIGSGQAEPYAIDRYGNFFSTQLGTNSTKGKMFNHSCFTAGTPVLCAGMCEFSANGLLRHIDNESGHYKPDRKAIFNAVNLMINQGVNGADLRVGVQGVGEFKGSTFAASMGAAPDWDAADNARLGLV
ncbi:hypothetical protein BH23GEM11_BH23GEM11_06040 [soil metagenome]